jgi:uncharacterized protein (TIGR02118 family)
MHKLVVLYPQPTDPAHFREYYVSTHLPLASRMPGMLDWRYSLDVASAGGDDYFAIFEADFADEAAMRSALSSPEGTAALADVSNYATGGSIALNYPVHTSAG